MKLIFVLLTAFFLNVSAAGTSQNISFSGRNIPLEKIFAEIKQQTGYVVIYRESVLNGTKPVNIDARALPLEQFIQKVLYGQPITYAIKSKTVLLSRKSAADDLAESQPAERINIPQYSITPITGRVLDSLGNPLSGATIIVHRPKGTNVKGKAQATTTTTSDGSFSVNADEGDVILISYIGMQPKTITITSAILQQATLSVTLTRVVRTLGDVEVSISTGYQKIKPEQSTGSISILSLKEYDSRINTGDFLIGLQNKIPGLLINNDVKFEGNSLFQIRGISTINGNKQPLIVIDGFPTELTLNMIDPYEIESVTVLKDAAAATVYGARSSNGVIVIERKKAKPGKVNINFQNTLGFTPKENYSRYRWDKDGANTIINAEKIATANISELGWLLISDPLYSDQYYNYTVPTQIMAHWRSATNPITIEERDRQLAELGSYNNTKDYARLFLRTASVQTYNLNMSGGTKDLLYYITGNYLKSAASTIKNNNDRFQISGRTMLNFSRRFSLELTSDFQKANVHSTPIPDVYSIYPYEKLQDENGKPLPLFNKSYSNSYYNNYLLSKGLLDNRYYPLTDINEVKDKGTMFNNRIAANFRYNIGYGLNVSFGGVYEHSRTDNTHLASKNSAEVRQYINRYTVFDAVNNRYTSAVPNGGYKKILTESKESYTLRAQLNYDKTIKTDHSLNAIIGTEIRDVVTNRNSEGYFGYDDQTLIHQPVDYKILQDFMPTIARSNPVVSYNDGFMIKFDEDRFISIYSNFVYSYKRKYSLSGSIRIDQSNLFGTDPKYRYKPLWSAGAAWNIHNEQFIQDISWIKSLKLRAAYGFNGNVAKNSLPRVIAQSGLTNSINASYSIPMLSLLAFANSGLRWEQTNNLNAGLDYELFKNVSGSIDYYIKKSTDILATSKIDATKGGTSAMINRASIRNSGIEISLHADWITTRKFNWNTGFVFSLNGSKVLNVYNSTIASPTTSSYQYVYGTNANYLKGYAVGAIFSYRYAGVDTLGNPLIYDKNGKEKRFFSGTDYGVEDVKYVGSAIPTHSIGMSNRVDIGRFYFYCMINYFGGLNVRVPVPYARSVRPLEGADHFWKERGDETDPDILPAIGNTYYSYLSYTDRNIVKGAYLTLSDLTASYSFKPGNKLRGMNFELRAQASNIFTVGFNKYNYSIATGSYEKSYMTPTYTTALRVNF